MTKKRQKNNSEHYIDAKKRMLEKIIKKAKEVTELGGGSIRFVCK